MGTREIAQRMMLEGQAIGEALGVRFAIDVDKRIKSGRDRCAPDIMCWTSNAGVRWR